MSLPRHLKTLVAAVALSSSALAQSPSISIDQINADQLISGVVRGVSEAELKKYKVIIYVQTDLWYIHPYAGQGEGQSWASVRANGTWQIPTVRRAHAASKVAAVLVSRDYPEPSRLDRVEKIPHAAIKVLDLAGTRDAGKL